VRTTERARRAKKKKRERDKPPALSHLSCPIAACSRPRPFLLFPFIIMRALAALLLDAAASSSSPPLAPSPPSPTKDTAAWASLAGAYAALAAIAAVQLARVHGRVPEFGWTTQKVFHALNAGVGLARAAVFGAVAVGAGPATPPPHRSPGAEAALDAPGLLFFSTYTLLILFWAEIYAQARSRPTRASRPAFLAANGLVYGLEIGFWAWGAVDPAAAAGGGPRRAALATLAAASAAAALGFLLYGGRLFLMLRRFPIESAGRRKKLREVGAVTAVCAACFTARAFIASAAAAAAENGGSTPSPSSSSWPAGLDVAGHPALNVAYYTIVELVPAALVLWILRQMPPAGGGGGETGGGEGGGSDGYAPIPADG